MTLRAAFLEVWGAILLGLLLLAGFVIAVKKLGAGLRARTAARLGLAVVPRSRPFTDEEGEASTLLHLFNGGAKPGALRGTVDGVDTAVFDYDYTLSSGFHAATKYAHQTVAALRCFPDAKLEFLLEARRRRDWGSAAPSKLTFELPPDFPRRYRVSTQQPDALRRLLTPDKLAFLTQLAETETWTMWAADGWLILYRDQRTVPDRNLGSFLAAARAIAARLNED
jgi:hypothetical protein